MSKYNLSESDKELLTFAAKAAGLRIVRWGEADEYYSHRDGEVAYTLNVDDEYDNDDFGYEWNPLTDDGDALRLAVKLSVDIKFYSAENCLTASHKQPNCLPEGSCGVHCVDYIDDPYAATRRAIGRAAAEIGKAMP